MYDRVLRFVNENRERPFFLMWTTPIPHSPMQAPDEMVQYYVEKFGDEAPIEGKGYFPSRWPHATYAAMITYFDRQVGGLVAELKRLGIWDDTIFVVTSDNGRRRTPSPRPNGSRARIPSAAARDGANRRCAKAGIRDALHRGVGRPHRAAARERTRRLLPRRDAHAVRHRRRRNAPTDGISLWPTIRGKERRQQEHDYLYWEFPGGKGWVAVRWGDWKGLLRKVKEGNTQLELYDVRHDLLEEHDVAADHPDVVARMWEFIRASHTEPENPLFKMEIPEV